MKEDEEYKPLEEHSLQELAEKEFVQRDPLIEHMLNLSPHEHHPFAVEHRRFADQHR